MASTRSTTGNSRPRVHLTVDTAPGRKRVSTVKPGRKPGSTTTTKKTTATGAGVKKRGRPAGSSNKAVPATHHKRKPHLSDKIEGIADKIIGTVTNKPGKKAAGTKKLHGTDGKGARGRPRKV